MMKNDKRPRSLPAMLTALTVALAAAGMGATAQAASVTDEDILKDAETTHQIVTNGLGTKGQRYSPLAKVNVDTVKDLVHLAADFHDLLLTPGRSQVLTSSIST